MALTKEQRQKIQKLITQVSQEMGTDTWQARTLIHKHVCGGKCNWYKTHSKEAGFNRTTLTPKQKTLITETINKTMKDTPIKEAEAQIHEYLCPRHPRPSE